MSAVLDQFPQIDATLCDGCSRCWTYCPDGAIASAAVSTEALLRAAANPRASGAASGEQASPKRRDFYRRLQTGIETLLRRSKAKTLTAKVVQKAFSQLEQPGSPTEAERRFYQAELDAVIKGLAYLPVSVTPLLFHDTKQGELLVLGVDPSSCRRCGVCAAVCPARAIAMGPHRAKAVEKATQRWNALQYLADTREDTVTRAAELLDGGALGALLMSRRWRQTMNGGDRAEPGSGERLAVRQLVAIVARLAEQRRRARAEQARQLALRLRAAIADTLSKAVTVENLGATRTVPKRISDRSPNQAVVISGLEDLGERLSVDMRILERLVHAAERAEQLSINPGAASGGAAGTAFRLILAGPALGQWLATFPADPFSVAHQVEPSGSGSTLADQAVREQLADCAKVVGFAREGEQLALNPERTPQVAESSQPFDWKQLSDEQVALYPPVVLLCGPDVLGGPGSDQLNALLSSGLPVKVVVLDAAATGPNRMELNDGANDGLVALAHRHAFVASCSVAYPRHLFESLREALDFPGPALIQLYTPSPNEHGFAPHETINRALIAVASRVRPLLRFNPTKEAEPGQGVSLEGNPDPDRAWANDPKGKALTPAHWAAGEKRFSKQFRTVIKGSETVAVDRWALLDPDEQKGKTPIVKDARGRVLALDPELAEDVIEYAEIWAHLRKIAEAAADEAQSPQNK